jgi:hypothetical protein
LEKCGPEGNEPKIVIDLFCLANTDILAATGKSSQKGYPHSENGNEGKAKKKICDLVRLQKGLAVLSNKGE